MQFARAKHNTEKKKTKQNKEKNQNWIKRYGTGLTQGCNWYGDSGNGLL